MAFYFKGYLKTKKREREEEEGGGENEALTLVCLTGDAAALERMTARDKISK